MSIARRILELSAGVAGLAVLLVWLSGGCGEQIEPGTLESTAQPLPADARVEIAESIREPQVELASGAVAAAEQTTVSSKILARIESISVRAGSVVARGDRLIKLDERDLAVRVAEASEELQGAKARDELARSELARVEKLIAANVASQQQLERARSEAQVSASGVQAARQRQNDAEVARSYGDIRSPVDGRVVDRLAEPGDTAAPGVPLLRIYDPGTLRLEVPVRESLAVQLTTGQTLRVEIDALGLTFDGAIAEIVPFSEPGARTLLVKVSLPPDPRLYAGMFGRVQIPAGERQVIRVPVEAVGRTGQLEFVRVVDESGRAQRRMVTTGAQDDAGRVEVLSGLGEGERVVR